MNPKETYRTITPNIKEYTLFSAFHGTSFKTDHISRAQNLSKYKKPEIASCILCDHSALKQHSNSNRITEVQVSLRPNKQTIE